MNVIVLIIMQYISLVAITGIMPYMLVVVTNDITPSSEHRQKLKTQLRCITHAYRSRQLTWPLQPPSPLGVFS